MTVSQEIFTPSNKSKNNQFFVYKWSNISFSSINKNIKLDIYNYNTIRVNTIASNKFIVSEEATRNIYRLHCKWWIFLKLKTNYHIINKIAFHGYFILQISHFTYMYMMYIWSCLAIFYFLPYYLFLRILSL